MANRIDRKAPTRHRRRRNSIRVAEQYSGWLFAVAGDWSVTHLNLACEDYVGRNRGEVLGRPVWDAHPALRGTECERQLRAAMAGHAPRQIELPSAVHPAHLIELRMFPVQDGLAVIIRDVTEERAREKALQSSQRRLSCLAVISGVRPS